MDFTEAGVGVGVLGNLVFQALQPSVLRPVDRADDLLAVVDPEDQPS